MALAEPWTEHSERHRGSIDRRDILVWRTERFGRVVSPRWGLDRDTDVELIWDRSYSTAPGWKALVPLLVCSDDLDLNCAVVAVEQVSDQEHVHWQRFGVMRGWIYDADPEVDWFEAVPPVSFEREEYMKALDSFRKVISLKLDWYD